MITTFRRWLAALCCCALMAAVSLALAAEPGHAAAPDQAVAIGQIARTQDGYVRGMAAADTTAFLGIPFAKPPVGPLRWQPPQPPAPWQGVRAASAYGPACAQGPTELTKQTGSEDCLYLNVWVPRSASGGKAKQLPVMVWLYGGGFVVGAGSDDSGAALASAGNAIVVTINYRLGPFGFLALPGEPAEGTTANLGLLDQMAALRWVQGNIASFGGDRSNVTLFGESAGAESICAALVSPFAPGLFQKAILESGPCARAFPTQAAMEQRSERFAAAVGCPAGTEQLTCLNSLSTAQLLAGAGESLDTLLNGSVTWAPSVMAPVLPEQPVTALAQGNFQRVPVLEGTNSNEGTFQTALAFDLPGKTLTEAQYESLVKLASSSAAPAVLAKYPAASYPDPEAALAAVLTDSGFASSVYQTSSLLARFVPVYQYQFADANAPSVIPQDSRPLGATHEAEIQYIFDDPAAPFTPAQARLARQLEKCWTTFARTGDPGGCVRGGWPAFDSADPSVENFAPGSVSPAPFAAEHNVAFWISLESAAG